MALGFIDLEKFFDTVPREMVMATLQWMGVPEAEVRMVQDMYEKTTAHVVVREGASDEFEEKIGLRQGSAMSPLLFIAVLDLISRKTAMKDAMKKLLYAADLVLVANGKRAAHRPPEGIAGHRAGGEVTDSGGQFRVPRRGSVRRQEDGERGMSKSTGRGKRVESS